MERPTRRGGCSRKHHVSHQNLDARRLGSCVNRRKKGEIPETEVPAHSEWGDQEKRMPKVECSARAKDAPHPGAQERAQCLGTRLFSVLGKPSQRERVKVRAAEEGRT